MLRAGTIPQHRFPMARCSLQVALAAGTLWRARKFTILPPEIGLPQPASIMLGACTRRRCSPMAGCSPQVEIITAPLSRLRNCMVPVPAQAPNALGTRLTARFLEENECSAQPVTKFGFVQVAHHIPLHLCNP